MCKSIVLTLAAVALATQPGLAQAKYVGPCSHQQMSVKELLDTISEVSGRPFPVEYTERREGDSTTLVANNDKAREVLGWEPQYTLTDIIRSAWRWHSSRNETM